MNNENYSILITIRIIIIILLLLLLLLLLLTMIYEISVKSVKSGLRKNFFSKQEYELTVPNDSWISGKTFVTTADLTDFAEM